MQDPKVVTHPLIKADGAIVSATEWLRQMWIGYPAVSQKYVSATYRKLLDGWVRAKYGANVSQKKRNEAEVIMFWNNFINKGASHYDDALRKLVAEDYAIARAHVIEGKDPCTEWIGKQVNLDAARGAPQTAPLDFGPVEMDPIVGELIAALREQRVSKPAARPRNATYQRIITDADYEPNDVADRVDADAVAAAILGMQEVEGVPDDIPEDVDQHGEDNDFVVAQRISIRQREEDSEEEPIPDSPIPVPAAEPNEQCFTDVDLEKMSALERAQLCITCEERKVATLFSPCGHSLVCITCSLKHHQTDREHKCPSCREKYDRIIKFRSAR